jgi:hypothetical protein
MAKVMYNIDKKWLGYILGNNFTRPSGQTARDSKMLSQEQI